MRLFGQKLQIHGEEVTKNFTPKTLNMRRNYFVKINLTIWVTNWRKYLRNFIWEKISINLNPQLWGFIVII